MSSGIELETLLETFNDQCRNSENWAAIEARNPHVDACGRSMAILRNKSTNAVSTVPVTCDRWDCPKCGPGKAESYFSHLAKIILALPAVFFSIIPEKMVKTQVSAVRLRLRQRRKGKRGEYVLIWRDNMVFVFSSVPLEGKDPPQRFSQTSANTGIEILMHGLTVPGISAYGISTSRGWGRPQEKSRGLFELIGHGAMRDIQEALERVGGRLSSPPPAGSSGDDYISGVLRELADIQSGSRFSLT